MGGRLRLDRLLLVTITLTVAVAAAAGGGDQLPLYGGEIADDGNNVSLTYAAADRSTVQPEGGPFTEEAYPVKWYRCVRTSTTGSGGLHVKTGMLFLRKSIHPGALLPNGTRFAAAGGATATSFVFRAEAEAYPFDSQSLHRILNTFHISPGSKAAAQVAYTLATCEAASADPHVCATSQQAVLEFASAVLSTGDVRALVTVVRGHGREDGRYTVEQLARIGGSGAVVSCHPMPYPYMVHYCHRSSDAEALLVELSSPTVGHKAATAAIAMCHRNTTSWDARYFKLLNATRGDEICHFMPRSYMLLLPAADL